MKTINEHRFAKYKKALRVQGGHRPAEGGWGASSPPIPARKLRMLIYR